MSRPSPLRARRIDVWRKRCGERWKNKRGSVTKWYRYNSESRSETTGTEKRWEAREPIDHGDGDRMGDNKGPSSWREKTQYFISHISFHSSSIHHLSGSTHMQCIHDTFELIKNHLPFTWKHRQAYNNPCIITVTHMLCNIMHSEGNL